MDKWFEAYGRWSGTQQLVFSVVFTLCCIVVIFLVNLWLVDMARHVSVWIRGWPPAEPNHEVAHGKPLSTVVSVVQPMSLLGYDWMRAAASIAGSNGALKPDQSAKTPERPARRAARPRQPLQLPAPPPLQIPGKPLPS